ncbi:hypothetical protein THER_1775 [Thermodesulfovibrio sp. N1]|nr:hypothetical protein THER_1775 [Thermodesulfovibrio sp. N1]
MTKEKSKLNEILQEYCFWDIIRKNFDIISLINEIGGSNA